MTTSVSANVFDSPDELLSAAGRDLGRTSLTVIDPQDAERFARATGAKIGDSGEVAPLLVLSLTNRFLPELLEVRAVSSGVNYGAGRIRFPGSAVVGDRIRAHATVLEAVEVPGGIQTTIEITVEIEEREQPACVVESISRWMR